MIRPSDAGAPHEPHGKGCAGIGVSVRCRCLGLQDLRRRDVGLVGYRLVRGVHGGFHGGTVFAERVGPVPFLGFVQVEGRFLVSVGLPGRQVAASRGLGLGFGCRFAFIGGGLRMLRTGVGVSTIGAASAFSVRSTSLMVLGSSPVALLSACEDSGRPWSLRKLIREAASSTPLTRAHHGFDDPVVVVARPLAGEPRVHEERGVVAVRGLERLRVLHPLQVHGHAGRVEGVQGGLHAGDWSV